MAKDFDFVTATLLKILILASGLNPVLSSQASPKQEFFLNNYEGVTLSVGISSSLSNFKWTWTSHDGKHVNVDVMSPESRQNSGISDSFSIFGNDLYIQPSFKNAGLFWFEGISTEGDKQEVAFEVFAIRNLPVTWKRILNLGSDWSMSCEISRLPEGATLNWTSEGAVPLQTTLFYDNVTQKIIHNIDFMSKGKHYCNVLMNTTVKFRVRFTLDIRTNTRQQNTTLFRDVSSGNARLTCKTTAPYSSAYWTRKTPRDPQYFTLTLSNNVINEDQNRRFLSPAFDGYNYPLHIAPLTFEDDGSYVCHISGFEFTSVRLISMKVTAVPSDGQQRVLLHCDLSQVALSVTLAWLRMDRSGRAMLVTNQTLSSLKLKSLNMTVDQPHMDEQHWVCAVFTDGLLRATALVTVPPIFSSVSPLTPDQLTDDQQTVVISVACVAVLFVGVLLTLSAFYYKRSRRDKDTEITPLPPLSKNDPVYDNITNAQGSYGQFDKSSPISQKASEGKEEESDEVHYSSLVLGGSDGSRTPQPKQESETVIYSAVNIH